MTVLTFVSEQDSLHCKEVRLRYLRRDRIKLLKIGGSDGVQTWQGRQNQIRHQLPQPRVLVAQPFRFLRLAQIHPV